VELLAGRREPRSRCALPLLRGCAWRRGESSRGGRADGRTPRRARVHYYERSAEYRTWPAVRVEPEAYQRSDLDPVGGLGDWPRGACPLWARWNDELDQRYTLGVEEELMLLEPADWSLAQSGDDVLARLSDELSPHTSPETHAAVVELATAIHPDVDGVVAELTSLRNRLSRELDAMGLTVAAAGTHPLTPGGDRGAGATRYAHSTTRCACSPGASRRWPCTCTSARRIPRTRSGFSTGCATESRFCLRCRPTLRTGRARFRVPVSAHRDLLGLSTRRPATVFRRLRRLRRHDRRADRLRGDTRSELLVVGRAAAARARDRRGQGDGRPVNGQGGHFPGRAGPVAGQTRARWGAVLVGGAER